MVRKRKLFKFPCQNASAFSPAPSKQFSSDANGDPKALLESTRPGINAHASLNEAYGLMQPVATLGSHPWLRDSLTNTSESFGLPQTADLQLALVTSEELEKDGLLMVKQLKNRYADTSKYRRFTIKVDRSKMRLSNDEHQQYLSDPIPAPGSGGSRGKPTGGRPRHAAEAMSPPVEFSRGSLRPSFKTGAPGKITF